MRHAPQRMQPVRFQAFVADDGETVDAVLHEGVQAMAMQAASAEARASELQHRAERLGVELTPAIGEALYVGLVTDTGKFQYHSALGSLVSHALA